MTQEKLNYCLLFDRSRFAGHYASTITDFLPTYAQTNAPFTDTYLTSLLYRVAKTISSAPNKLTSNVCRLFM
jgi:hypothetical protein